jgi:hypothetical protein
LYNSIPLNKKIKMNARRNMSFKERLQWLGRMPTKWRVLIGGQAVFFAFAVSVRMRDIEKSRFLLEARQQAEEISRDRREPTDSA